MESSPPSLVPGRECGTCTACCQYLPIDDQELKKSTNQLCHHCTTAAGCGIYEVRPKLCRNWYCGWRLFDWVDDQWKPDEVGIIIRAEPGSRGITFLIVGDKFVVFSVEFLEVVGDLLVQGVNVHLSIPGPVGYFPETVALNEPLADAVRRCDLGATRLIVAKAMGALLLNGWTPDGIAPVDSPTLPPRTANAP
jgi:hypothetical protein